MGHHLDGLSARGRHALSRSGAGSRRAALWPRASRWRSMMMVLLLGGAIAVAAVGGSGAVASPGAAATSNAVAATGTVGVEVAFHPILALALHEQPTTATLNTPLDPPVVVRVVDAGGNPVVDADVGEVEVMLRNPPGVLGPLGGQTSAPVVDGEAVLDDLRVRTTGEGYHLDVEVEVNGTWLETSSEPFTVVAAAPARPGHVDAVDCAQAAPGAGLLHLDGRRVQAPLVATDDGRGVRLVHPAVEPSLSVPPTDPQHAPTVSGATLLLEVQDTVSVLAGRLLPSSPVGVWLLGDPPCPLAASGGGSSPSTGPRQVVPRADGVAAGTDSADADSADADAADAADADAADADADDAAMVEVTPIGTLTVSAAGTVQGSLALPAGLTPGAFTAQVVGTLADGCSMLAATGVLVTPPLFADVDPASVHTPAIRRITALGITTGRADGTYGPGATVTRGQMASFLARALELDTSASAPFPDAVGTVHEGAVAAVAEAGIARGYPDGTFGVGDPIRRDQMASMLAAAGLPGQTEGPFEDVAGNVHAPAINAVAAAGIALGDGQGRYLPGEPVRRDQMASFLVRLLDVEE